MKISPSILSADFGNLAKDIDMLNRSNADWVHVDVMDGVFVPNISFGFPVLKPIVNLSTKVIDTHLMIVEPEKYLKRFAQAGSHYVTFHIEATDNPMGCIDMVKQAGAKAGISIKPATAVSAIEQILPHLDLVLVMSVEPGFGGQKFMSSSVDKVKELKRLREERGLNFLIQIDGGVDANNAAMLFEAGCDVLVAGSAVFNAEDPVKEIDILLGR